MVIVSLCPWNGILSTFFALRRSEEDRINVEKCGTVSLEDEPFLLPVFCFFAEGPTSLASFNLFCCHSWKLARRLATIYSFSSASSTIGGTISSTVSHCSIFSALNVLSRSIINSWVWRRMIVFFFVDQGGKVWNYPGSWTRGLAQSPFLMFFFSPERLNGLVAVRRQQDEQPCRKKIPSTWSACPTQELAMLVVRERGSRMT